MQERVLLGNGAVSTVKMCAFSPLVGRVQKRYTNGVFLFFTGTSIPRPSIYGKI